MKSKTFLSSFFLMAVLLLAGIFWKPRLLLATQGLLQSPSAFRRTTSNEARIEPPSEGRDKDFVEPPRAEPESKPPSPPPLNAPGPLNVPGAPGGYPDPANQR